MCFYLANKQLVLTNKHMNANIYMKAAKDRQASWHWSEYTYKVLPTLAYVLYEIYVKFCTP